MNIIIVVGPDDIQPGAMWAAFEEEPFEDREVVGTGGTSRGPKDASNPHAWWRWAKRNVRIPGHKIMWEAGDYEPIGYSEGRGHAPHGIKIEAATRKLRR